ncbi:CobW family GTP-binding protein [Hansschlegelia quercus]|uniref:CobW family GTP-binding protein n=1 Tax=Hansschlegelia quercus TaxID=2528245 RepID=UPI00197A7716|nr:GTP-binding protein [Hansschlegelia quercus]
MTVLTGFLGAGKTTILNAVLSAPRGQKRYGVIVNEFGAIGVDGSLVIGADEDVIELANGCLCCSVRGDLIGALETLLERGGELDAILVETTGLADPGPIAATFLLDDDLSDRVRLDGVVTVLDAVHVERQLAEEDVAASQIAFADLLVLAKSDIVNPAQRLAAEEAARALNSAAPLLRSELGDLDIEALFGLRAYDLNTSRLGFSAVPAVDGARSSHAMSCVSLTLDRSLDPARFMDWMQDLVRARGRSILRSKGVVSLQGEDRRLVFQGVQTMLDGDVRERWAPDEDRRSRLVFIGRDMDKAELQAGLEACIAHPSTAPQRCRPVAAS